MIKFLHNRKIQIYIVQAFICSIAFIIFSCSAVEGKPGKIPLTYGFINDFEYVFTQPEIGKLEYLIRKIEHETAMQIAIVTLDASYTTKAGFDSTTLYIAKKKWEIGRRIKSNGILIGISKSMKEIKIQNGYGAETKLSSIQTKEIIDKVIIPQFKKGNYFEGTSQGILSLYDRTK